MRFRSHRIPGRPRLAQAHRRTAWSYKHGLAPDGARRCGVVAPSALQVRRTSYRKPLRRRRAAPQLMPLPASKRSMPVRSRHVEALPLAGGRRDADRHRSRPVERRLRRPSWRSGFDPPCRRRWRSPAAVVTLAAIDPLRRGRGARRGRPRGAVPRNRTPRPAAGAAVMGQTASRTKRAVGRPALQFRTKKPT